jgi:hypothetical protein
LTKLWSIKLIATAVANPPELNFGRVVLHGALQTLNYDIIVIHKLTPNIQEVIAFPIWLSVKQKSAETVCLESVLYSPIRALGTNTSLAPHFM